MLNLSRCSGDSGLAVMVYGSDYPPANHSLQEPRHVTPTAASNTHFIMMSPRVLTSALRRVCSRKTMSLLSAPTLILHDILIPSIYHFKCTL